MARVAAAAELEHHPAGTTIFSQGAEPVSHLRVVRSGAVELVLDGRTLDLLGAGELFGQTSMLSGLPTGFTARARRRRPACAFPPTSPAPPWAARRPCATVALAAGARAPGPGAASRPPTRPTSRSEALVRRPLVACAPTRRSARRRSG